jgi:ketosteroid isomerase-like protein
VEGSTRGMAKTTGCEFFVNWVMVCTLENGKIKRFRNYYDTADLSKALLGTCEVLKAA